MRRMVANCDVMRRRRRVGRWRNKEREGDGRGSGTDAVGFGGTFRVRFLPSCECSVLPRTTPPSTSLCVFPTQRDHSDRSDSFADVARRDAAGAASGRRAAHRTCASPRPLAQFLLSIPDRRVEKKLPGAWGGTEGGVASRPLLEGCEVTPRVARSDDRDMEATSGTDEYHRAMRALERNAWSSAEEGYAALAREAEAWSFQVMKRTTKKNAMYLHCARCNKELRDREMETNNQEQEGNKRPKYPKQYTGWRAKLSHDAAKQWTLEILHEEHAHHHVVRTQSLVESSGMEKKRTVENKQETADHVKNAAERAMDELTSHCASLNAMAVQLNKDHPEKLEELKLDLAKVLEKYKEWEERAETQLAADAQPPSKRRR